MLRLRIFISSPGDVGYERGIAGHVIERLELEFGGRVALEAYVWERNLITATRDFQSQILDIREADLAVFILWARIGTRLSSDFRRPDGTPYLSGTEYEFERALEGSRQDGRPDIVFFRKVADVVVRVADRAAKQAQREQEDAVDAFIRKWFEGSDGSYKGAYIPFENAAQFEDRLQTQIRAWIQLKLRGAKPAAAAVAAESPFRGLMPFEFEHALLYCGRTALVSGALEALRRRADAGWPFLMATGMSGSGKSSLVRAGLLPMLSRPRVMERVIEWRRAVLRPSDRREGFLASMAAALAGEKALPEMGLDASQLVPLLCSPAELEQRVRRAIDQATAAARGRLPEADPESRVRLALVVDQFEEIFDGAIAPQERNAGVEALVTLMRTGDVWVIATMRSDFYPRVTELPESFRDYVVNDGGGLYSVPGPRAAEIAEMVLRPAALAGATFERRGDPEEGLDDLIRRDAAEKPNILPLLEFTLDELWKASGEDRVLRFKDYEALRGLHGALQRRADQEFARLPPAAQDALPTLLSALVHVELSDQRLVAKSRVPLSQIEGDPHCRALVDAFIKAHLVTSEPGPDGSLSIGLAHEAMLREWKPVADWIEKNRDFLRKRAAISTSAALYHFSGKDPDRLLQGASLKKAQELLKSNRHAFTAEEREYILECARHARSVSKGAYATLAALAAIIALPIVGWSSIVWTYKAAVKLPAALASPERIPLSRKAGETLKKNIEALSGALDRSLASWSSQQWVTPWVVAQTSIALMDLDYPNAPRGPEVRRYFAQTRDPGCACWRETQGKVEHRFATAWVLYSLAMAGESATPEELQSLLAAQSPDGWWSIFPSAPDPVNASTATTAWSLLALRRHLAARAVPEGMKPQVCESVKRASAWLYARAPRNAATGLWTEYPPQATFEKGDYLPVASYAMHALGEKGAKEWRHAWLRVLPERIPELTDYDNPRALIVSHRDHRRTVQSQVVDESRHYRFPWLLRATLDAYAEGGPWQRARAAAWVDDLLERPIVVSPDLEQSVWIVAEILIALRHADGWSKVRSQSQQPLDVLCPG